ncbi:AzlD domain-containing protein [Acuticoccus sp.]|uniref:AzlD domain-containing protein n=1 Tax=Acuticoccus sp. TaxID=1904378 RepID=UPI003B522EF8
MTPETSPALAEVGILLGILIGAALPTQVWRWLGVFMAGRLDDDSELFTFIKAVATALVASVVAKLVLSPSGALGETPVALRVGAVVAGFAVYLALGQRLALGILTAEVVLVGGWLLLT